jgi:hypothetical protein
LLRSLALVAAEEFAMAEKTYVADVAFESIKYRQTITSEETERLTALLGAGYIHEVSGSVYATSVVRENNIEDEESESELLERFEDLDVVEVSTVPVASKKRTRKE